MDINWFLIVLFLINSLKINNFLRYFIWCKQDDFLFLQFIDSVFEWFMISCCFVNIWLDALNLALVISAFTRMTKTVFRIMELEVKWSFDSFWLLIFCLRFARKSLMLLMGWIVLDSLLLVGLTCFWVEVILQESFVSFEWSVEGHW